MKRIALLLVLLAIPILLMVSPVSSVYAPRADVLPVTFTIRDRAGAVITTSLTIGVRVVDQAGNGINDIPVAVEICANQNTPPCSTGWVSRVSGTTRNIVEDGWQVAPSHNNNLFRITCGAAQQEHAVDANTATLVVTCVSNPTAVVIESIRASAYVEDWALQLIFVVSALAWGAIAVARRYT